MPFKGTLKVPGDKSIAHRVLFAAALREGETTIYGVPGGTDVRSTLRAIAQLGADVRVESDGPGAHTGLTVRVRGWGSAGPLQPDAPVDCGNSGTTARLLMGILAPWGVEAVITGDASLRARPMRRVTEPLSKMGASFDGDTLPLRMRGDPGLRGIRYELPVPSAQVKSAILFAGLRAVGKTRVVERTATRDHTERLLESGIVDGTEPKSYRIPGDSSSAAFALAAAVLAPGSSVSVPGVAVNPLRIAYVRTMQHMGAPVRVMHDTQSAGEPVGRLLCAAERGTPIRLRAVQTESSEAPALIDEFPVLALLAACAEGESVFRGVQELRHKESDRITGITEGLERLGVRAFARADGGDSSERTGAAGAPENAIREDLHIIGKPELAGTRGLQLPEGLALHAHGDHRLALTWQVARLCCDTHVTIRDKEAAAVSYAAFEEDMRAMRTDD